MTDLPTRFLFCALGFSALMVSATLPVYAAQPNAAKPLYTWKTENATDEKTGALQHCLVKNAFDNDTMLMLAENHENTQRLAIHFAQDVLQENVLVDLTLQVDKQDVFPVEAIAATPRILTMSIPESFPDQLRKGNVLHIRGPQDEIAYQLGGTDTAIRALRDCITSHKNPVVTRTKLAAISDADADTLRKQDYRPPMPAEMMATPAKPVSADAMQKNLGIDTPDISVPDTTIAAKDPATLKPTKPDDTAMPAVPVAPIKEAAIPAATPSTSRTAQKTQDGILPKKWQIIFRDLALAPKDKTLDAAKMRMTAPLQYAWLLDGLKIGFNPSPSINVSTLDQAAKHYMFNMRRQCSGEFIAEADSIKVTTNGKTHWQIAEIVCADAKSETLSALLFTTGADESTTIVIEGPMAEATRIIRLRNNLLQRISR